MEHAFSPEISKGKTARATFFKNPIIPRNFPVERPENVCPINIPTGIFGIS